jgi:hypothetical protein
MVKPQERWKHGYRTSRLQRSEEGMAFSHFFSSHTGRSRLKYSLFQVKKILVPKRENPIINRLNKTKVEKFPDLAMERQERIKAQAKKNQAAVLARVSSFAFLNH